MAVDDDRRRALLAAKLGALVRDNFDVTLDHTRGLAGGASGRADGRAFFLSDDERGQGLGQALAAAVGAGTRTLDVLAERSTGRLARRAALFDPPPTVWRVDGRSLSRAAPVQPPAPRPVAPGLAEVASVMEEAGADVLVEHGTVVGEVMGLEVARVVDDGGGGRVEVGVGRHDREAFQIIHGDRPTGAALAEVVRRVAEHRRPGADPHPLNRLGAERWLRALVVRQPSVVGAAHLAPVPPPEPRTNLKDPAPCLAAGEDADGAPLLVAFSTGIDLSLVPVAADARALDPRSPRLILAVPARDAHPVTGALIEWLADPADLLALPGDWRALG